MLDPNNPQQKDNSPKTGAIIGAATSDWTKDIKYPTVKTPISHTGFQVSVTSPSKQYEEGLGLSVLVTGENNASVSIPYKTTPGLKVETRIYQASLLPDFERSLGANTILQAINDPKTFEATMVPMPWERQEVSRDGTRTFRAKHPDFPGRILVFSGIGVVKDPGTKRRIFIESPRSGEPVSKYMQMGTIRTDADGKMWSESNHTPFGSYNLDDVIEKVSKTSRYASSRMEVVAAGGFKNSDLGWLVYTMPDNTFASYEALEMDLRLPLESRGEIYGSIVQNLFSKVRHNHDNGIAHLQIHPGNWFGHVSEGKVDPIITDWSTATDIKNLPKAGTYTEESGEVSFVKTQEKNFGGLTPEEKILALDMFNAFSATTLLQNPVAICRLMRNFEWSDEIYQRTVKGERVSSIQGYNTDFETHFILQDSANYQFSMICHALAGYYDVQDVRAIEEALKPSFENVVRISHNAIMHDSASSYKEIFDAERDYGIKAGIDEYILRLSRFCVQNPDPSGLERLKADDSLFSGDKFYIVET